MTNKAAAFFCSRTLAILLGLYCATGGAIAADLKIVDAKEVWSGVYEGRLDWTHQPRLVEETSHIPGRLDLRFGTYFTVPTEPANARGLVRLRYKTMMPAPGVRDFRTGQMTREIDRIEECILGRPCLTGYIFESPDEIIPGEWRFTVSFRGKELISKSFIVETSSDGPVNRPPEPAGPRSRSDPFLSADRVMSGQAPTPAIAEIQINER